MSHGSLSPRSELLKLIAHHKRRKSLKSLRQLHTLIMDRARDAHSIGWTALYTSWMADAALAEQAVQEICDGKA